jgi:DivIVA domain-containing protein
VALDRQSIEKKDFPIGRRGYDPEAVDAHLAALASEVDELKRSSRRRNESLAAAASEQVRSIVEAAESSAAAIQRQAEEEALDIRSEAGNEAQATREQATTQARDYVGNVSQSTTTMVGRLDAMQNELGALFEALRTGSNRLNADLQLLEQNLDEVRDAVNPRPRFEPEPSKPRATDEPERAPADSAPPSGAAAAAAAGDWAGDRADARAGDRAAARAGDRAEPELESAKLQGDALYEASAATPETSGAGPSSGSEEAEGARLVALNMALNGTPRDETERYLAENFRLSDRRELLDDVYASVQG